MSSVLALIPARGGSKRIPRKNIRDFLGSPMIKYPIDASLKSGVFDEVMVSTEDQEISQIAQRCGAKIPFLRSDKTSTDHSSTLDVIFEVIKQYEKRGQTFKYACCIYPGSPFITPAILKEGYSILTDMKADSVMPVAQIGFAVSKVFYIENGKLQLRESEADMKARNQDLKPCFHDAGQFYWFDVNALYKNKTLLTDKTFPLVLDDLHVQDIDNESDWKIAEVKYRILKEMNLL